VEEEVIKEEVIAQEPALIQAPEVIEEKKEAVVTTEAAPLPKVKEEELAVKGPPKEPPQKPVQPVVKNAPQYKPQAVIVANPLKGYPPLRVSFNGRRSKVKRGRIVSYYWDFGDGDSSDKPACTNTYYSGIYGTENFEATLTVQDDKGNTDSAVVVIQVLNK